MRNPFKSKKSTVQPRETFRVSSNGIPLDTATSSNTKHDDVGTSSNTPREVSTTPSAFDAVKVSIQYDEKKQVYNTLLKMIKDFLDSDIDMKFVEDVLEHFFRTGTQYEHKLVSLVNDKIVSTKQVDDFVDKCIAFQDEHNFVDHNPFYLNKDKLQTMISEQLLPSEILKSLCNADKKIKQYLVEWNVNNEFEICYMPSFSFVKIVVKLRSQVVITLRQES